MDLPGLTWQQPTACSTEMTKMEIKKKKRLNKQGFIGLGAESRRQQGNWKVLRDLLLMLGFLSDMSNNRRVLPAFFFKGTIWSFQKIFFINDRSGGRKVISSQSCCLHSHFVGITDYRASTWASAKTVRWRTRDWTLKCTLQFANYFS